MRPLIETVIVLVGSLLGFLYAKYYLSKDWTLLGVVFGFCFSLLLVYIIRKIMESNFARLVGVTIGVGGGLVASWFVLSLVPPTDKIELVLFSRVFVSLVFGYFGGLLGLKIADFVGGLQLKEPDRKSVSRTSSYKILDTSAIIDGRIADISETGFFDYKFIVPTFVLKELQDIADNQDPLIRARGRRGFDVLKRLKDSKKVEIKIFSVDFPDAKDVDEKLLRLAKKLKAQIITTDYNLNQVASIQGVEVLNINDLAKALRPLVVPGEELEIFIIKPGKDPKQGVGYLDDGTMVVVEDGKSYIGEKVKIFVTNMLQTSTGRIIFGRVRESAKSDSHKHSEEDYKSPYHEG